MTRASLTLVVLIAVGAPPPGPANALQAGASLPVTIPFEVANRHIVVQARVNDSRPLSFLLDTGASAAIIRIDTARELGLTLHGEVRAGGAGPGTVAGQRVKGARWSLVGFDRFSQPVTLALPLTLLPTGLGRPIDGIIGGEFIKQFVLELDYQARSIRLHDRKRFRYDSKGETVPIEFTPSGAPVVAAMVTPLGGTPIRHRFMLDIGSGLALAIHSPFVAEHNLLGGGVRTIRATGMAGAGGVSVGRLGRVASLQIGSFRIENVIALFSQDKVGAFANASLAGNIGAQIASRFRMILDYSRNRIMLEPAATFADPFDRAMAGMALRAEGADYRTYRVREVLEASPAADAGITAGDLIQSIDGTDAAALTLTAINEMLEKAVPREMTIRRGEQVITLTLTPRRLI